jgi:1-acyl-sn-glycerol-3-phosphate acyltransferase
LYHILILIARTLTLLVSRCRVAGKENIPKRGPFIVVANHLSVCDPVLLGAKLPRKAVFMAKEELFRNRFSSYIIRHFGAFPVYRGRSNRDALRQAGQVLKQGGVLGMFPEGKRSMEDSLQPALFGTALIAYHNKALILPVSITGSEVMRGFNWIWRRPEVTITFGKTFKLPETEGALTREQLAEHTNLIMQHIAELLPEKYLGEYAGNKRKSDEDSKS